MLLLFIGKGKIIISDSAPILLFDSGLGGLSVLSAVRKKLPDAPIVYAGDTENLPYGDKSETEITTRVAGILGRLCERYQPRLVCIACNTASTIALDVARSVLDVPIVGTVPAIKPASAMSKSGTIGLLGTAATVRQKYVDDLEANFAAGKKLIRFAAPGLVRAAEAKLRGESFDKSVFEAAANGLHEQDSAERIDTVVLACTHFPLVQEELATVFGPDVTFIDGAEGIAKRIAHLTKGQHFSRNQSDIAVLTGQGDPAIKRVFARFGIDRIEQL